MAKELLHQDYGRIPPVMKGRVIAATAQPFGAAHSLARVEGAERRYPAEVIADPLPESVDQVVTIGGHAGVLHRADLRYWRGP